MTALLKLLKQVNSDSWWASELADQIQIQRRISRAKLFISLAMSSGEQNSDWQKKYHV